MGSQLTCSFKIESWDETEFSKSDNGPKAHRATVTQSYSGDLEASSTIEYLMITFDDDTSSFIGFEEVVGELSGKSGSFLLNHKGRHKDGIASSTFEIVPESGTGELEGISGSGNFEATHDSSVFKLVYNFKKS